MKAGFFVFRFFAGPLSPVTLEENCEGVQQKRARRQLHGGEQPMKLISCVIRPDRLPAVKEALFRAGVTGITITRASGHGGEQDTVTVRRGTKLLLQFHEKVKIEMACSEPFVEATIAAIVGSARTGMVGDGKIFVQPLDRVVRIRTGERDNAALTPVTAEEVQKHSRQLVAKDLELVGKT
jgi:nitrogen regulatory protein P-II 1